MRFALVCVVELLFLLPVIAADGQVSHHETRTASETLTEAAPAIPFRLLKGYSIVVQGLVGSRKCNMLVDTGANPTIIDSAVANDLRLPGTDAAMALMNGTVHFRKTELPVLALGPVHRNKIVVLVRDLRFIRQQLGVPIDVIVGMDFLATTNFTIDYQHKQLLFTALKDGDEDELDFVSGPPFIVVNAAVGESKLKLLVDTGTPGIVLFDSMVHGRLRDTTFGRQTNGTNIAGKFPVEELVLPNVRLSKTKLGSRPAFLTYDQPGWGRTFDGLLGPTALELKKITFDFKAGKLRWKH